MAGSSAGAEETGTVAQVRDKLREVRLDADVPSFFVRQHAAARAVVDETLLRTMISAASGANQFGAAVAESDARLAKERCAAA